MKPKKIIPIFVIFLFGIALVSGASGSLSVPSSCCERTTAGARCINTDSSDCDGNFKVSPTSCESTSYCKMGTCYDSFEGICMENTPQTVCNAQNGTWDEREAGEIPQCQLGCCLIVDQASFVPLVRCKRLSTFFGVSMDYRSDVTDELSCIALSQAQEMGACVYEEEFERACKFTTRGDCNAKEIVEVEGENTTLEISSEKTFYKDYLCSAEELNTNCARQVTTNCYQQKVYWFDSCGNRENIYSSDKGKSWNNGRVLEPDLICPPNDGSNKECGNCDYLLGSRCSEWTGFLGVGKPKDSDYFCKKTVCKDRDGKDRKNGESWCVYDVKNSEDVSAPAGSRYYREICIDGEVHVEPCADYRNEVCLDSDIEGFGTSGCRVNRWQDCAMLEKQSDCENQDVRDCRWIPTVLGLNIGASGDGGGQAFGPSTQTQEPFQATTGESAGTAAASTTNSSAPVTGSAIFGDDDKKDEEEEPEEMTTNRPLGVCVPNFAPGLEFWADGDARGVCNLASARCVVKYEKKLIGDKECVDNCECLEDGWAMQANEVCKSLGDCGAYINYVGKFTDDGYEWKVDENERRFNTEQTSVITGKAIGVELVRDLR